MEISNIYMYVQSYVYTCMYMYADYILTLHARTFPLTIKAAYHCCVFSNDNSETVQCKERQHFGGGRERWGGRR